MKNNLQHKFLNHDGTLNKTTIAAFLTLLIVLAQQIMLACGFSYGHWDQIAGIINTILAVASVAGFVEGDGSVQAPKEEKDETK